MSPLLSDTRADKLSVDELLSKLTVDEKVALLAGKSQTSQYDSTLHSGVNSWIGKDFWHTTPLPHHGISSIRLSDGPNGVRGTRFFDSVASSCLPCGTALGATFNTDLLAEIGQLQGQEAKAKGVVCVLGPTLNIQRGPLGGRGFESFSERSAAFWYPVGVLRDPRAIMTAYNKVNGVHVSESKTLLQKILREEWKFDGLVMSDWFGTYSTTGSVHAGLDLEMPGPTLWRGPALSHAIMANKVTEEQLDNRVRNVLNLINYSRASGVPENAPEKRLNRPQDQALLRRAASESIVLLKNNDNVLPFVKSKTTAVIGPNAKITRFCGGGSASLLPYYSVSPYDGIAKQCGKVCFSQGAMDHQMLPQMGDVLRTDKGQRGFTWRAYNEPATIKDRVPLDERYSQAEGIFTPEESGLYDFGLGVEGTGRLFIDDALLISNIENQKPGETLFGSGTVEEKGSMELVAGQDYEVRVEWGCFKTSKLPPSGPVGGRHGGLRFGAYRRIDPAQAIEEAAQVAKSVDQVVLVVGLNGELESEGTDRTTMDMSAHTNALVSKVLAANVNTAVVVQSGTPVGMPWIDDAKAVCHAWYGGNETGYAIADVLFGDVNPAGKLPLTIPRHLQDNPTYFNFRSEAGRVLYGEDVYVGYRYYEKIDCKPLYPFGHGLSYTTFSLQNLNVQVDDACKVTLEMTNTGSRAGAQVVQVYVAPPTTMAVARPVKELKSFRKVYLEAGEKRQITIDMDTVLSTSYWHEGRDKWCSERVDSYMTCDNCKKSNSQCTFQLPSKARGPKRKTEYRLNVSGSVLSEADLGLEAQSPTSPQSFSNPGSSIISLAEPSVSPASCILPYATDILFPRDLVRFILNDYVTYIYPLIPVIHRPSFETDLDVNRDLHDDDFLTLIVSLCAVTVGLLPSRLQTYREFSSPLPFHTRSEMANCCYKLNQSFRDTTYFDTVSHQKWASSFLLGVTFHQTGNNNLWRMFEVESMQLLRLLEVQHISSYAGLDAIEVQLRKKAFWLMFYGYLHQMHNLRNERLTFLDPVMSCEINFEDLMPVPVDDEYISSSGILSCPETEAAQSLTSGFNIHSRIFLAALRPPGSDAKKHCICSHVKDPAVRLASLQDRVHHLKYMLDTVLPAYRSWSKSTTAAAPTTSPGRDDVVNIQREAIRANIHVTQLWLQIMLLDQIDTLGDQLGKGFTSPSIAYSTSSPRPQDFATWDEREDICRQFLHLLNSLSQPSLEPNGLSLVYKVRDVAVSLLSCPYDPSEERTRRATEYLREFARLLSILDVSEQVNLLSLQSWIDTSRDKHTIELQIPFNLMESG
ncbi:glycosyl hydrolase family 3 N terminal domain-containing protein [Fusarium oxysporum f. sp. phaseoli]